MNVIKQFLKKIPLLTLVVMVGMTMRVFGIIGEIAGVEYHLVQKPVYATLLDAASQAIGMNRGEVEEVVEEPAPTPKPKTKPGYESAEEEAKRMGTKLKDVIEARKSASNNTYFYSKEGYPREAEVSVVGAKDYGVANVSFMDPEGTTYDYLNDGIFVLNNDYYKVQEVGDSYFKNALFIGDSRTDGLHDYGGMEEFTNFYAQESVTIYNLFKVKIPFSTPTDEKEMSLKKVLKKQQFGKIYISVGMNELGVPDTTDFRNKYMEVVQKVREAQPKAIIYIVGVTHVSVDRSKSDPVFNNKAIVQRNEAISKLANGYDIFYLDMNPVLCTKKGNLRSEYTNDGVHLTAQNCKLMYEYFRKNAIVRNEGDL